MKAIFAPALTLLLMLMVAGVQAGSTSVYKWVDSQGNVHFGDKPTGSAAEEVVVTTSDPTASPATPAASASDPGKTDSEACKNARKQLSEYERAPFLYETDADGKRHILPDNKREELLESVRNEVETACGG